MKSFRNMFVCVSVLLTLAGNVLASENAKPVVNMRSLSHGLAMEMVKAAVDDCTKRGFKVAAAVVGRDGNLLALLRNPLSGPHTVDVSQRKAYTAASFQAATSIIAEENPEIAHAPNVMLVIGGMPIDVAGHFYGAVGVSGAQPKVDEECAQTAIDVASDVLEFAD
jgi:uncharacterized protein GlcG (DUF336 family)